MTDCRIRIDPNDRTAENYGMARIPDDVTGDLPRPGGTVTVWFEDDDLDGTCYDTEMEAFVVRVVRDRFVELDVDWLRYRSVPVERRDAR